MATLVTPLTRAFTSPIVSPLLAATVTSAPNVGVSDDGSCTRTAYMVPLAGRVSSSVSRCAMPAEPSVVLSAVSAAPPKLRLACDAATPTIVAMTSLTNATWSPLRASSWIEVP